MMKRALVFILLMVMLATACGSNDTPTDDKAETGEETVVQPGDGIVTVFRAPT